MKVETTMTVEETKPIETLAPGDTYTSEGFAVLVTAASSPEGVTVVRLDNGAVGVVPAGTSVSPRAYTAVPNG